VVTTTPSAYSAASMLEHFLRWLAARRVDLVEALGADSDASDETAAT
jgi:hypothetical protein